MCDLGTFLTMAGAGVEAYGSVASGEAKAAESEFKAQVYGVNADIAESNIGLLRSEADLARESAGIAYAKGALAESRIRAAGDDVAAAQRVNFVARNLDPSVGSPMVLAAKSASQVQADIDITRATAVAEGADAVARGASLESQAVGQAGGAFANRVSAGSSRLFAGSARLAGKIGAGVALLKGASTAYTAFESKAKAAAAGGG